MQIFNSNFSEGFKVLGGTEKSQAASMVLSPGSSTGGPDNKHKTSDQWLYVISGNVTAIVNGKEKEITPGKLLLIEAGETHEIKNTGKENLETLNFYAPKEY